MNGQALQVKLVDIGAGDRRLLDDIVALGDRSRQTLGFLPRVVFDQAAENGTLVAAIHGDHVIGYALYSLPRQVVRLTHLCISDDFRGHGIARRIVDRISNRHADRFGITLKCRNDFPANSLWPHLRFELQGQVPGRGRQRRPLSVWWRDHGHPNLFSTAESIGLLRVALDVNVFLDLESGGHREGAAESQSLAEDWLADQVELVVTTELRRELHRLPDSPERTRQRRATQRYPTLAIDASGADTLARHITDHVLQTQNLDLSLKADDRSDVRHIAETSLAGVTVLATRDEDFLRWSAKAVGISGVRVMRPADVILHVDELSRASAYRPVELLDTGYRLAPVRAGAEDELLAFSHANEGEQKSKYLNLVRNIRAEGRRWTRTILRNPQGKAVAFYAIGIRNDELVVPVLRIVGSRLEETIIRQLLFLIRNQARREGQIIVRITDPNLAKSTQRAVREEGFIKYTDSWIGFVISACAKAAAVDVLAAKAAQQVGLHTQALCPGLSSVIGAELERTLWPAKITDSDLQTYVVPIRPHWSAELFGVPQILTPRRSILGLSREHVYYRSPTTRTEVPARLVWYVTDAKRGGMTAVIGCSRLDEAVIDKPAALFRQFRHLGVWRQDQVAAAAKNGKALALRFADTEIFTRPVTLRRLRQLAAQEGQTLALRSPQKITPGLFAAIYQEGYPDR